jgi:hypothetical protein
MPRHLALVLLVLLVPAPLAAQASSSSAPLVRVDFGGPSVGIGAGTLDPGVSVAFGGHVTAVHRSGHGARVDFTQVAPTSGELLGPSPASGGGWMLDVAYAYRIRVAGDDRLGLGLDVAGGISAADLHFYQPTSGLCIFGPCSQPAPVAENVADGAQLGANAGLSLDFRAYGFLFGIDARYRALLGLEARSGDRLDQHLFTASAYFGFGFY